MHFLEAPEGDHLKHLSLTKVRTLSRQAKNILIISTVPQGVDGAFQYMVSKIQTPFSRLLGLEPPTLQSCIERRLRSSGLGGHKYVYVGSEKMGMVQRAQRHIVLLPRELPDEAWLNFVRSGVVHATTGDRRIDRNFHALKTAFADLDEGRQAA